MMDAFKGICKLIWSDIIMVSDLYAELHQNTSKGEQAICALVAILLVSSLWFYPKTTLAIAFFIVRYILRWFIDDEPEDD